MPYEYNELKEVFHAESVNNIECPIKGSNKIGKLNEEINDVRLPIKLRKTTFIYLDDKDNFIFEKKGLDADLLNKIKKPGIKREKHRMGYSNSEDALTWNVFRSLDKENMLNAFLSDLLKIKISNTKIIYWSYDKTINDIYEKLKQARLLLQEEARLSTEPDIILECDQCLVSIEAKYKSSNPHVSENENPEKLEKYQNYNNFWQLFNKSMKEISIGDDGKYELARNWLLGDAMRQGKPFYLINLTLEPEEKDIVKKMEAIIKKDENHCFMRTTWEDIYSFCKKNNCCNQLVKYLENLAYYESNNDINKLKRALNIK